MKIASFVRKVTAGGQTTIPKEICRHLGIESGDPVLFTIFDGETVVLEPAGRLDVWFLRMASDGFVDWNSAEADEQFREL